MNSYTSRRFREMYADLPVEIQSRAKRAYSLFRQNPAHPGLQFKRVGGEDPIYSARIGLGYRALGEVHGKDIVWFWIGSHSQYDKLLSA